MKNEVNTERGTKMSTAPKTTVALNVNIMVEKDGNGYYATCPPFKGLHVYGQTKKEALELATQAIVAYSLSLLKHNEPIPCDNIIKEETLKDLRRHRAIVPQTVRVPLENALAHT